jgi:hypothetical protein
VFYINQKQHNIYCKILSFDFFSSPYFFCGGGIYISNTNAPIKKSKKSCDYQKTSASVCNISWQSIFPNLGLDNSIIENAQTPTPPRPTSNTSGGGQANQSQEQQQGSGNH